MFMCQAQLVKLDTASKNCGSSKIGNKGQIWQQSYLLSFYQLGCYTVIARNDRAVM